MPFDESRLLQLTKQVQVGCSSGFIKIADTSLMLHDLTSFAVEDSYLSL